MEGCLFCRIVTKDIPAQIIYEDDMVIAFNDINPVAPVHVLIVPKKHIATMQDAEENDKELLGHILLTAQKIAADVGVASDGYRLVNNCGKNGGQVIFHLHLHLLGGKTLGAKIV